MAAVTHGAPRRQSLLGKLAADLQSRARARGRPSRLAAAISDHAMTVAAMTAVDVGMFHLGVVTGWVTLGASILVADYKMTG